MMLSQALGFFSTTGTGPGTGTTGPGTPGTGGDGDRPSEEQKITDLIICILATITTGITLLVVVVSWVRKLQDPFCVGAPLTPRTFWDRFWCVVLKVVEVIVWIVGIFLIVFSVFICGQLVVFRKDSSSKDS
jgi:hypothetical protein